MRSPLIVSFLLALVLALSGCGGFRGIPPTPSAAPQTPTTAATAAAPVTVLPAQTAAPADTATPFAAETAVPTISALSNTCSLINSSDLARLFTTAETQRPRPVISRVGHPFFSGRPAAGVETVCAYHTFHQPGSKTGFMVQVIYWLDVPNPGTEGDWDNAWTDAKGSSGQPVTGIGQDAFISSGRLVTRQKGLYLTIEAIGTNFDASTTEGANQQINIEKQMAQAALGHL